MLTVGSIHLSFGKCHEVAESVSDVVYEYSFAGSEHHIEAEDFDPWMQKAAVGTSSLGQIAKHMYWVLWIVLHIPDSIASKLDANGG